MHKVEVRTRMEIFRIDVFSADAPGRSGRSVLEGSAGNRAPGVKRALVPRAWHRQAARRSDRMDASFHRRACTSSEVIE